MEKFADLIVKRRKWIITIFLVAAIIGVVMQFFVKVNYNMVDYLPPDAQSTKALEIMQDEFTEAMPNTSVMIRDLSVMEAVEYKAKLAAIEGVEQVMWLDDMIDIKEPLEMADSQTVESFYKNGHALFSVTITKGMEKQTTAAIQDQIGEDNAVAGESPDLATVQTAAGAEVLNAMAILLPAIILILILSTTSWAEPILFLAAIGVSILINMGTNLFLGEISFMTNSVSPILQMACSLDYAIFVLHSFAAKRKVNSDVEEAMRQTIKESMSTVAASCMTTLFGFLALVFMNFQIGADLGINLAKGIILSFLSCIIFLPAVTLSMYKFIDKTQHRELMPSFRKVYRILSKIAIPVILLVAVVIFPAFRGQGNTEFVYGNENLDPSSRTGRDSAIIKEEFGQSTVMVLLVPRGDVVKEKELCDDLLQMKQVTGVMAYASAVGTAIPPEYLGKGVTSQFYGENYARIILYTDTNAEGTVAFQTVQEVQDQAALYYGDTTYSLGQSVNLYDMKTLVQQDNSRVNLIAVIAIFVVLMLTFRSLSLPIILILTIETGIWINLSIPYFTSITINFMGYLVISTVQLGATVDYAILLTSHYLRDRQTMPKREAISQAMGDTFRSILVSAAILSIAGFVLYATTSNPSIADIGLLLGRGTIFSLIMVTCFLPAMLTMLDPLIRKTTLRANFYRKKKKEIDSTGGI